MELPKAFEEKMKALLGDEFDSYTACYKEPRYYGLRVNTAKISVEEFVRICPFVITPVPWIENGFYYDGEQESPARHPYYFAGLYYLQEPSAMTPANRLEIHPGDRVLDVCAAPGGKATELGAKLHGEGVLIANDISSSRAKGLLKNLELFGIGNMLVLSEEPGKLCEYFPEYFDKILIDAPCSGEGMFRKDKKMVKAWEEHGPEFFSRLQRSILTQAAAMLRPGGMLLYSTCTFDPLENEGSISWLLEQCPEFDLVDIRPYEGFREGVPEYASVRKEEFSKTVRIFPHHMKGEGHYLALLLKKEDKENLPRKELKQERTKSGCSYEKLPEDLRVFLKKVHRSFDVSRFDIRKDRVYYMPDGLPNLSGVRFLRSGLLIGELKKGRFEPSQAFAMNLKKGEYEYILDFPVSDERVIRYLKGETLLVDDLAGSKEKGWYLVCVDGYPLGFGKLSQGTLKNKCLPGWRWQSV